MFYQLSCWHAVALAVRVYSDVWNLAALHGHLTWKLEFLILPISILQCMQLGCFTWTCYLQSWIFAKLDFLTLLIS